MTLGSSFRMALPLSRPDHMEADIMAMEVEGESGGGMSAPTKTILIVDDDPDIALVLTAMLEDAGYAVVATNAAGDLMGRLVGDPPDLILLDMLLSGHDGREIASQLKARPETERIPILMLSAYPTAEREARSAGADDFLAKPFEMDMLLAKVAAHLT